MIHETCRQDTMWDSLDSSPLFIILVCEYFKKTNDLGFIKKILVGVEKAYLWSTVYGDNDGDHFLEYDAAPNGLVHHCWKDSRDGMTNEQNELPQYPIAPVEVQGYYYSALMSLSELYKSLGKEVVSQNFQERADSIKKKFNKDFWMEKEGFFAMALDGNKDQITVISSNVGHALWSRIIEEEKVESVVKRLLEKDIFTKFGIRTLSDKMGNFDAFSYHRGSIWPFDNWFFAEGLEKYGHNDEANKVRENVLNALTELVNPLECYTYSDGELGIKMHTWDNKVLYPEKIQAWTLGAMYSFVSKIKNAPEPL
ncbi:hypothetical protein COY62_03215 [bacterium (Candidatus Howlettbacteria) CG_4_10_14_0_8_um_filter_40_9]|nr:MAG: hypothetical protein COY62_03215 [bacterium (Candidatus Howlettbacteria) CG_4_10_14_0_8_um_filter_40_9]